MTDTIIAGLAFFVVLGLFAAALIARAMALRPRTEPDFPETKAIAVIGVIALIWLCVEPWL